MISGVPVECGQILTSVCDVVQSVLNALRELADIGLPKVTLHEREDFLDRVAARRVWWDEEEVETVSSDDIPNRCGFVERDIVQNNGFHTERLQLREDAFQEFQEA